MSDAWVALLAAPAGAIVGATVAFYAARPRPVITIAGTSIESSRWAGIAAVPVNQRLSQAVADSPVELPDLLRRTTPERTYVTYLNLLQQASRDQIEQVKRVVELATELRQDAASEEYDQLLDKFKFEHGALWSWAEGESRRGRVIYGGSPVERVIDGPPGGDRNSWVKRPVFEEANLFGVVLGGTIQLIFDWNPRRGQHAVEVSRALAERTATAFASDNRQDLMDFFASIRDGAARAADHLESIQNVVEQELAQFSRLKVEILLSNAGRAGMSVGGTAIAKIYLDGYPLANRTGNGASVAGNVDIDLRVVSGEEAELLTDKALSATTDTLPDETGRPLVVQSGETIRLTAVSEHLLSEYPTSDALRSAYAAAERVIQVHMLRFQRPRWYKRRNLDSVGRLSSRKVLFRNVQFPR